MKNFFILKHFINFKCSGAMVSINTWEEYIFENKMDMEQTQALFRES